MPTRAGNAVPWRVPLAVSRAIRASNQWRRTTVKTLTKAVSVFLLGAGFWAAQAGPEWCEKIGDGDKRNLCTAETRKEPGYCQRIKNNDQRHFCEAVAEKNSGYCEKIGDTDLKFYCRART